VRVLILGSAVSGQAAARLSRRTGHQVAIYDRSSAAVVPLRDEGFQVHSGAWSTRLLRGVGLVVTSPGIPEHAPPITDTLEAGITLWSELEFGARSLGAPYLAVTGTNGKTTVTTAIASMLRASGMKTVAAGNVGTPVSAVAGEPWDMVVLEASSFQLRFIERFHPQGAAVLNVAPDHLDWHETLEDYTAAKARIFENMTERDVLVYDCDDPGASRLVEGARPRLVPVSGQSLPGDGNGPEDGLLSVEGHEFRMPLHDPAYVSDFAAAATLARSAGAVNEAIQRVLDEFESAPHRRHVVATRDGVTWVDDSKATNPHAARSAGAAYPSVVLIAGGRNKGLDLGGIAGPTVRKVIAYGEAGPEIARSVTAPVITVDSLQDALMAASAEARQGDTVLLAPGCASFDQFSSYAERGDVFAALVDGLDRGAKS